MRRSRNLARPKRLAIVALAALSVTALVAVPDYTEARSRFSRGIIGVATAPVRTVMRAVPGFSGSRFGNRRAARAYARAPSRGAAVASATAGGAAVASVARPNAEETDPSRVPQGARPAAAVNTQSFNAYEDLIGYALWPQDYAARFWSRGYGDFMKSMVSAAASPGMCSGETEEQAAKPVGRLAQAIELTEPQRVRLAELRSALGEAVARGKAACRDTMPAAPSARLKLSADGLWSMRDADILLRTPLVNFYATLSDAQKAQLGSTAAELPSSEKICSLAANDLPVGAIEQSVRPTEAQRASLEMMKGFSSEMSGYLASSCPNEAPADPVGRLDAAGNRVSALLYAVMLFDQALNGFYSGLSDDQKKRFDGVRR
jgi:LTXXQ motif family protein